MRLRRSRWTKNCFKLMNIPRRTSLRRITMRRRKTFDARTVRMKILNCLGKLPPSSRGSKKRGLSERRKKLKNWLLNRKQRKSLKRSRNRKQKLKQKLLN